MPKRSKKEIPIFKNEDEEREFWGKADSTEYIEWDEAEVAVFPNLKHTTRSISPRIPKSILAIALGLCLIAATTGQEPQQRALRCPDLEIKAPNGQFPWYPFEASLVLTDEQRAGIRDVRWTITKHNTATNKREIESVSNALSVETKAWDANEAGQITWLVVGRIGDCISAGSSWSMVTPNPGSPMIMDEFGDLSSNDERGRLDLALAEMLRNSRQELLIFARFQPGTSWRSRRTRVQRMFDHMISFRKFDAKRVTFLISESSTTSFILQRIPCDLVDVYRTAEPGALVIPGEQLNAFVKLFK